MGYIKYMYTLLYILHLSTISFLFVRLCPGRRLFKPWIYPSTHLIFLLKSIFIIYCKLMLCLYVLKNKAILYRVTL